jgi:hypothetical protein
MGRERGGGGRYAMLVKPLLQNHPLLTKLTASLKPRSAKRFDAPDLKV